MVKRVVRWLGIGVLALVTLLLVSLAGTYVMAEVNLRHRYEAPTTGINLPTDSQALAEGLRLARIRGCAGGCHGDNVEGGMFIDDVLLARLPAPNLTAAVRDYSDAELVGIIRHGVRPDGRSVIGMPSGMFRPLSDADLGERELKLMSEVARSRFANFTDEEIGELYHYLITRANMPVTGSLAGRHVTEAN